MIERLTEAQMLALRPYAFDNRTPVLTVDDVLIPSWSTLVTVHEDGALHWPITLSGTVLVGVLSGPLHDPLRGSVQRVNARALAIALGHI